MTGAPHSLKQALVDHLAALITPNRRNLFHRVLAQRTRYLKVVLAGIADPMDVSAVMRSCECFGIQDLHVIRQEAGFQLRKGISVGSAKWIDLYRHDSPSDEGGVKCLSSLRAGGYRIVKLGSTGTSLLDLDLSRPAALLFDQHSPGANPAAVDVEAFLPTTGFSGTFNISVHVALCLYVLRQRLAQEKHPWELSRADRLDLELIWLAKTPKRIRQIIDRFLADRGLTTRDLEAAKIPHEALQLILGDI